MAMDIPSNERGNQLVQICVAFTTIALIVVGARLYTRFLIVRYAGPEDYCIIIAMVSSIGLTIADIYQVRWGLGRHFNTVSPEDGEKSLKAFLASLTCYSGCVLGTKASILLQYIRVFTIKKFQMACWVLLVFLTLFGIWTIFGTFLICVPLSAFWTHAPNAKCLNQDAMWYTGAAVNIVTDFIIILLPTPVIGNLNLNRRQKAALIGIFGVGGFVCVISIIRIPQLTSISNSNDPTYDNASPAVWSAVESNVAIICACLPLLRPLFTEYLPGIFSSVKRTVFTEPRPYSTIGVSRVTKRDLENNSYAMESTIRHPRDPNDVEDQGIQVITDIQVQVQDDDGNISRWRSDEAGKDWTELSSPKKSAQRSGSTHSSTDTLVKERSGV